MYIVHALASCCVASAVSSQSSNSELRNPEALTSPAGAPILGVHSLRPVSGTTSSWTSSHMDFSAITVYGCSSCMPRSSMPRRSHETKAVPAPVTL